MEEIVANDDVLSQNDDLLIDVSCSSIATDARSSGPGIETSFEQTGTVEIVSDKSTSEKIEEMPKLIKTPEPEKPGKNVKFNLRKSLAWDSAFFTSDGVLDADELSTMIEGGVKGVKHQLPGIEEEVYRSMESISTMESDTLESLEAELFDDIRASIQKSNRTPNLKNSSNKLSSGKKDSQPKVSSLSKKADLDSRKPPVVRIRDNSSTIPQPKIITRLNPTLTKRASLSANQPKKDQDMTKQAHVTQKGTQAAKTTTQGSKLTGVIGPRRGVPKPLLSSKSTPLKTDPTRPSSSCSNSSSCSSETNIKSSVNFQKKKVDPKTSKLTTGSIPKTPSRIVTKNKPPPPANSRLSSHSVSSNHSSSISPASSISEWSSESSSSTSVINRRSTTTSRGSIDTGVSYRSSVESASTIQNGNQSVVPSSQSGSISRPPGFQPTGLRMPSPKIGFFDGGKSGARTPNKLPTVVPKTGATNCSPVTTNGVKSGKIPPPKTCAAKTNMKPNFHKTTPKPSQEQPNSKPKIQSGHVTSDVSDHKGEPSIQSNEETNIVPAEDNCINPSHNVDNDLKKQSNSGNISFNKTDILDNTVDKSITDGLRTPFAVKNSVCDTNEIGTEITEKTVNFPVMESQHKENSEVI